jgi:hypothetical protein
MNKRFPLSFAFSLVLSIVLPAQVARADDFRCDLTSPAPPVVMGNLVVPRDGICFAIATQIRGNVLLEAGAHFISRDTTTRGNVQGQGFVNVDIVDSRIGGNIRLERGRFVFIDDLFIGGNDVDGNVQIEGITDTVDLNGDNFIAGNLKVVRNAGSVDVSGNIVRKQVEIEENTGGVTIANNVIGQQLRCETNAPAPVGGGNVAEKKKGQCAGL